MKTKYIGILLFCFLMQGCEAPLDLEAMNNESNKAVHRSDRLQAITDNGNAIISIGSFGVVLVSENKSNHWQRISLTSQPSLIDIASCPNKTIVALALEGSIWVSLDNGKSWNEKPISSTETPQAITCTPNNKIWVVGSFSSFLSSEDGGDSWESASLDEDMILSYIEFFDSQHGIATGEFGNLLSTNDGGVSWIRNNPIPNEFYPISSLFTSMSEGVVVGLNGKIFSTKNTGKTWETEESHTKAPLYGLAKNKNNLYIVGALGTFLVKNLNETENNWHVIKQNIPSYLRGVLAYENRVIIAGDNGLIKDAILTNKESEND